MPLGIIKAKFIGKSGSMGFVNGRIYSLRSELKIERIPEKVNKNETRVISKPIIKVYDTSSRSFCGYTSLSSFFKNWKVIQE